MAHGMFRWSPNVGAHAEPIPPVMAWTWNGYGALPPDYGRYSTRATFGPVYGGGLGAIPSRSREVTSSDGKYRYKQFSDESIQILVSPSTSEMGTTVMPNTQRWLTIVNDIGTWADKVRSPLTAKGLEVGKGLLTGGGKKKRKGKKKGKDFLPSGVAEVPEKSEFPIVPVAIGGGILAVVLLAAMLMRSK